jgi:hypothetical protein
MNSEQGATEGPAKGYCTLSCVEDTDCEALESGALCVVLPAGNFCTSGCVEGSGGVPKCHARDDVACSLAGVNDTTRSCTTSGDCESGELCAESVCASPVLACLPTCGGDYDCAPSQYCDFFSGYCSDTRSSGLPLGSPCDPNAASNPCNGFCLAGSTGTDGVCSALCTFNSSLTGCGWDGTGPAENACLFTTILSTGGLVAQNDVGTCGQLCDCNRDCSLSGEYCLDETGGEIQSIFGRSGYCRPLQSGETLSDTFSSCP